MYLRYAVKIDFDMVHIISEIILWMIDDNSVRLSSNTISTEYVIMQVNNNDIIVTKNRVETGNSIAEMVVCEMDRFTVGWVAYDERKKWDVKIPPHLITCMIS